MADSVKPRMRDQVICQVIEPATASAWPTAVSTAMVSPFPPARGRMVTAPGPILDSHYTLTGYSPQRLAQASSAPGVGLNIAWRRPHPRLAPAPSAPRAAARRGRAVSRSLWGGESSGSPPAVGRPPSPGAGRAGRLRVLGRIGVFGLRLVRYGRELVRQAALVGPDGLLADPIPGVAGPGPVHRRDAERVELHRAGKQLPYPAGEQRRLAGRNQNARG